MNAKLYGLLAAVAVVGSVTVYTLGFNATTGQPTTIADAADAGALVDCSARIGSCTVELSAAGRLIAADAGLIVDDGGTAVLYAQVKTGVLLCSDGGVIVPRLIAAGLNPDQDDVRFLFPTCTLSPCSGAPTLCQAQNLGKPTNVQVDTKPCRKRPVGAAPATCLRGAVDWGDGNVMPAAEAVGSGCVPAACVVTDPSFDP